MSGRPDRAGETRRWVEKAEHDLIAAEHDMKIIEEHAITDVVCFHCQQCAEKYLKALLIYEGIYFPKTHDLRLLMDLIPKHIALNLSPKDVVPLNRYSIEGRYPGEWDPVTIEEARFAIGMARKAREAARAHLPEMI